MARTVENTPAEGGIILAVICENFMCHRFLEIKLGPFMNFVIGHNGSGKSAILTALTLCLGGKAASTNRGNSMKTLIKEGTDTARITVKLKNGGDGYKSDLYGDVIIIERQFSRDGQSHYKLKSSTGKIISGKRDELDDICDFYGLQVDNPLTILTQDMARQFLSNSSNSKMYTFFAKGVQLEQLDADYSLIHNAIKNTEASLDSKKVAVSEMNQHMCIAHEKVQQYDSHDSLREKYTHMQYEMAWVQVRDAENDLAQKLDEITSVREKISKAEAYREEATADYEVANQAFVDATSAAEAEQAKLAPFEEARTHLREKFDGNRKELSDLQAEERELRGSLQGARRRVDDIRKEMKEEELRLEERNGGSSMRLMHDLSQAEKERDELKDRQLALEETLEENKTLYAKSTEQLKKCSEDLRSKKQELQEQEILLNNLQQSEHDIMAAFDPKIPALLRAIDQQQGWIQKPIGPCGKYITLRKQNWMSVVERFFGGTLVSFIVTNHQDGELLQKVISRVGIQIPVFVTAQKEFNIQEPDPQYDTILKILDVCFPINECISNDHVRRQIIIGNAAEQAILIEDLEDANAVMSGHRENISMCFALNRNKPGWGHKVGGNNGAMGVSPVPSWPKRSRMKSDSVEAEIRRLHDEIYPLETNLERLKREQNHHDQAVKTHARERNALNISISRSDENIENINARITEMAVDGKMGTLQEHLKTALEKKKSYEDQYGDFSLNRDRLNNEQEELTMKMNAAKQDLVLAQKNLEHARLELDTSSNRRAQSLLNKNHWYQKVADFQTALVTLENELRANQETVKIYSEKATEICPRVDVTPDETTTSLDSRLRKLRKELEDAETALGGTREEITDAYLKAVTEYEKSNTLIESFNALLAAATRVLTERRRRWAAFRRYISVRARSQFSYMMSERAFKGRLRLEHTQRPPELIIEVQPGGEASGNRGPKTLSGGEKSFSTICLLLSLWEAMGSPIRCLDEFDVYMDSVNRSISVDMMIKTAERSIGRQFIMITPQNMNTNASTQTKIIRPREKSNTNWCKLAR
ncbi:P-loop containing nucleoside triphosphate hydrolase protein [Geopyxis carbonaria]|nr:P-loop containing nucleoside triphosphate hydrolase protein [Geopyxis carbonaria]